ncbi:response regulator [Desulfonema magnum]|uniref:histidine kinase n=1 Tax=Desulfonema magnum TaxID=45655 RepID=A0A975BJV5_9BACT|nr:response regulator [Desulfonema magnum]QTA86693.1 Two component system response regulator/histidine kinase [Desulfonema magnum]
MNDNLAKKNILIVDDAPANIRVLVEILTDDYEISVATNGPEALEIATSRTELYGVPDLILLDIMMPEMDGYEVCKILRQHPYTKDIPIIFITANTDDDTLKEAFESGGTDYVRKPVNKIELLARIKSALTQQELTKKLLEEEKLEGVLEMAGAVCHELNQPMQSILGFSQLLIDDLSEEDPRYEYIKIIKTQIDKMGKITKKLMRITRYETREYIQSTKIIDINKAAEGE